MHGGLDCDEGFDNDVLDPPKNFVGIDPEFLVLGAEGFEGPLVSILTLIVIHIINKVLRFLVDTEVGQMLEPVLQSGLPRWRFRDMIQEDAYLVEYS